MDDGEAALRSATPADWPAVLSLWTALFDDGTTYSRPWSTPAEEWFLRAISRPEYSTLPVIEVDGDVVATAVGSLVLGVPNPWCPRGRSVRLENVCTRPDHRGRGFGTQLVAAVVGWAATVSADRIDLSTTALGRSIYKRAGFIETSAPRMKLVL